MTTNPLHQPKPPLQPDHGKILTWQDVLDALKAWDSEALKAQAVVAVYDAGEAPVSLTQVNAVVTGVTTTGTDVNKRNFGLRPLIVAETIH